MVSEVELGDTVKLKYELGRPGGWVHDMTLFSDVSIWVQKRMPGYYGYLPLSLLLDVKEWCNQHLQDQWSIRHNEIYIKNQQDATLFALRWS